MVLCALAFGSGVAAGDGAPLPNPKKIAIAGIRYGMTPAKVRSILGRPQSTRKWHGSGRRVIEIDWRYSDRLTVSIVVRDGRLQRVNRVRTYSPRDRLPNGLHVNSKWIVLRRKLPSSLCFQYSGGGGSPWPSGYVCTWSPRGSKSDPCAPELSFYMRHRGDRIKYIELAGNVGEGC